MRARAARATPVTSSRPRRRATTARGRRGGTMARGTTWTRGGATTTGRRGAATTTAALGLPGGAIAGMAVAATACAAWCALGSARETSEVRVTARRTKRNAYVLDKCGAILERGYDAVAWLKNRHASTILSSLLRRDLNVAYQREVLAMPDGGHATLDWPMSVDGDADLSEYEDSGEEACEIERRGPPFVRRVFDQSALVRRRLAVHHARIAADAPVLVLMSGIAGGSHDKYLKHFLKRARARGFRCVAFNCRGTSESPLTTPQFYSASYTGDIRHVVNTLRERYPDAPLFAIGWSLGANILTNFLGEEGENAKVTGAAALCNPFDLNACDTALESGFFGKVYSQAMAKNMRKLFAPHENLFAGLPKYNPELVKAAKTVRDFDEAITRVTFGFPSVDAYYEYSGSKNKIGDVRVPLMTVQARDDPIAIADSIPRAIIEENPNVILLETESGGHLGWEAGPEAPFGAPWPDAVVMQFFEALLELKKSPNAKVETDTKVDPVPAR
jgi:predicted alpha/beta-fold hydrolase